MKQAIAGVSPAEVRETTIMSVWPSICVFGLGDVLGRLYAIRWPNVYFFRLGSLLALLFIPVSLALYFARLVPGIGTRRYTLTNRRVVVERGVHPVDDRAIELDRFDEILVSVGPGQAWYHAGDLVFRKAGVETFRLPAVPRPESFRHVCIKAHMAYVGIRHVRPSAAAAV